MRLCILPFSLDEGKTYFPAVKLVFLVDIFDKCLEVFGRFIGHGFVLFTGHTGYIIT